MFILHFSTYEYRGVGICQVCSGNRFVAGSYQINQVVDELTINHGKRMGRFVFGQLLRRQRLDCMCLVEPDPFVELTGQ